MHKMAKIAFLHHSCLATVLLGISLTRLINGAPLSIEIIYPQEELAELRSWTNQSFPITVKLSDPDAVRSQALNLTLELTCDDKRICDFPDSPYHVQLKKRAGFVSSQNVTIAAHFLGYTFVNSRLVESSESAILGNQSGFKIVALRAATGKVLGDIFTTVVTFVIVFNTFMMGTQLEWSIILKVMKRPIGPVIGLTCQYIGMPCIAFFWATMLLGGSPSMQFGYFASGCSPGGGNSNFWTILYDGNVNLSVAMTFCSNVAALVMMPAWLFTVGQRFFGGRIYIPFWDIASTLPYLIVPCIAGMVFIHFFPKYVKKFRLAIKIFSLLIVFVFTWFFVIANLYVFRLITFRTLLPGALLPWTGYLLALTIATICKQSLQDKITIAIETGIQNGMIAMLICKKSLQEPDSDLTMVMPVSVILLTSFPLMVVLIVLKIKRRCCPIEADELKNLSTQPEGESMTGQPKLSTISLLPKEPIAAVVSLAELEAEVYRKKSTVIGVVQQSNDLEEEAQQDTAA